MSSGEDVSEKHGYRLARAQGGACLGQPEVGGYIEVPACDVARFEVKVAAASNHSCIIGAEGSAGKQDGKRGALGQGLAQETVSGDAATENDLLCPYPLCRRYRFGDQHIYHRLLKAGGDINRGKFWLLLYQAQHCGLQSTEAEVVGALEPGAR